MLVTFKSLAKLLPGQAPKDVVSVGYKKLERNKHA
jgi:hypothetical protein